MNPRNLSLPHPKIFEGDAQVDLMYRIKKKLDLKKIILFLFCGTMLLCLSGCMVLVDDHEVGESLSEHELEKIQPGRTTKQEVLEMFGPPLGIARRGEILNVPTANPRKTGLEKIPSETFFELFAQKHSLTSDHIIYYYFSSKTSSIGGIILFAAKGSTDINVAKLWVLINEKTAIVEDYKFRRQD